MKIEEASACGVASSKLHKNESCVWYSSYEKTINLAKISNIFAVMVPCVEVLFYFFYSSRNDLSKDYVTS